MTPPAMTATGHRRTLRHQAVPTRPRRVSGPARGRAAAAPLPAAHAHAARALALIKSLPEHSLLDRLVRGRAWIPVLGVMLAGIVTMQVEVLKLGTSAGEWMQRASALQTKNESLQANVASLADDQRIERLAAGMGMMMPAPTAVSFLPANGNGAVGRALSNIHAPDPAGFLANLAALAPPAVAATSVTASVQGTTTTAAAASPPGTQTTGAAPSVPTTPGGQPTTAPTTATQPAQPAPATAAPPTSQGAPAAAPTQAPATGAASVAPAATGTANTAIGG